MTLRSSDSLRELIDRYSQDPFDIIRRRRGWSPEFIDQINRAHHGDLPDIDLAVELIRQAIAEDLTITILTDFDMDGVAAGLLTYGGLAQLGADVQLVIPDYNGPRNIVPEDIDHALELHPTTSLIITCDVGISSNSGIDHAQSKSIPVIVTDHHLEDPQDLCRAAAAVNPNRISSTYPEPDICGSQVALHVLTSYAGKYDPANLPAINLLSVFAGIGGLADVMPLRGQTRDLVKKAHGVLNLAMPPMPEYTEEDKIPYFHIGNWNLEDPERVSPAESTLMQIIKSGDYDYRFARLFYGLSLLLKYMALAGKIRQANGIEYSFIGFNLTPMFNTTRRIEADMADSFNIFAPQVVEYERGAEYTKTPAQAACQLIENNELRKKITTEAMEEFDQTPQPWAPYVYYSTGVPGILGLLANNIMRQTDLPTLVINPETGNGSARAPEGFDIIDIVTSLGREDAVAVGHQQACGVRLHSQEAIEQLVHTFDQIVTQAQQEAGDQPQISADLHLADIHNVAELGASALEILDHDQIDLPMPSMLKLIELTERISALEPFGQGFEEPDIKISFQPEYATFRVMSVKDDVELEDGAKPTPEQAKHLKITTPHGVDLLWWNNAEQIYDLADADAGLVTAQVTLGLNEFAGKVKPQGIIRKVIVHRDEKDDSDQE